MSLEQALKRPLDYIYLTAEEQWAIDKDLGILDWNPPDEVMDEYSARRHEALLAALGEASELRKLIASVQSDLAECEDAGDGVMGANKRLADAIRGWGGSPAEGNGV